MDWRHRTQARPPAPGWNRKHQAGSSAFGNLYGQQALPSCHRHAGKKNHGGGNHFTYYIPGFCPKKVCVEGLNVLLIKYKGRTKIFFLFKKKQKLVKVIIGQKALMEKKQWL